MKLLAFRNQTAIWMLARGSLVTLLLLVASAAWAQSVNHRPDPRQLFQQMQLAAVTRAYQGYLTYEHDGQMASYALASRPSEGTLKQQLRALSGPERHFRYRRQPCPSENLEQLRTRIQTEIEDLSVHYNFYAHGDFRVAGREAYEITVMPVDRFRYGYSYAVDAETGLMLRGTTLESDRRVVERFQFVNISPEADQSGQTETASEAEKREAEEADQGCIEGQQAAVESPAWQVDWLPDGFQMVRSRVGENGTEMVFGDGMATFSLFIVPVEQIDLPPASTSIGASSLLLNYYRVDGVTYRVTMVGEVPPATLEQIAGQLHYRGEDANAG